MYFSNGDIDDNTCIKDLHECIISIDDAKDNDDDNDNANDNNHSNDKDKSSSYIIGIYALKYSYIQIYI